MSLYCPNPNWPESRVPKSTSYQRVIWHIFNDLSQSGRHSSKCLVPLPVYLEENYQQWRRSVSLSPWGLLVHSIDGVLAPRLPPVFCVGKAAVAVVCLCHEWGSVVKKAIWWRYCLWWKVRHCIFPFENEVNFFSKCSPGDKRMDLQSAFRVIYSVIKECNFNKLEKILRQYNSDKVNDKLKLLTNDTNPIYHKYLKKY